MLKKRWKHLKDQYRKELKKQPVSTSGAEAPAHFTSSWQYFQLMSFMKDELIPAETVGNLDNSENDMQDTRSLSSINQDDLDSEIQSSASHVTPTSSSSSSRKRTANTLREDMLDLEKKKILLIEKRLSESEIDRKLKTDEDYLFLMSILPTMKKLTDIQKLRFRGQINGWLLEAVTQNQYSYVYGNSQGGYFTEAGQNQVAETHAHVTETLR